MQKGQITLFVILGMLIIIIIGFAIYLKNSTVERKTQATVDQLLSEVLEKNAIPQYVKNCLATISTDATMLIAKQGGAIYKDQGGIYERKPSQIGVEYLPYTYEGEPYDAHYGIRNIEFHPCQQLEEYPPDYPVAGKNVSELTLNSYIKNCQFYDRFSGYFGVNNLPKLCDPQGPNRIGATQTEGLYKSCEPGTYGVEPEKTIQRQLQKYIQQQLPLCANFSILEDAYGNRIEVLQKPNVTVILGEIGILVKLQYPFLVHIKDKEPLVKNVEFAEANNLRLKKLYYFVNELLQHETQELSYNIKRDHKKANFYEESFVLTEDTNPCPSCNYKPARFDRLYVLKDEKSKVLGQSLAFLLPVRNRRPVLDKIKVYYDEPYNSLSHSKKINASGQIINVDVAAYNGTRIMLQPEGYDPDDDTLAYAYGAWKEDENSNVTNTACFDPSNIFAFQEGVFRFYNQNPNFCTSHTPAALHAWSSSSEYATTKQKADYVVTNSDIGLHKVNITVKDQEGLNDYQEIYVLIIPEQYRNLTNPVP